MFFKTLICFSRSCGIIHSCPLNDKCVCHSSVTSRHKSSASSKSQQASCTECFWFFFFSAVAEQNLAQVRAQGWRATFLYLICFVTLLSCHLSGVRHRVDSAGRRRRFPLRLRRAHVQTTLRSFSPSHALSSANKATVLSFPIWIKKTSVIAQIRAQRVWQVDTQKKQQKKKTLGLSYQSVSLHLPLHTSAGIVATAGPVTSFNIQVLWKGGGGGGVQSRQVREREFIIQTLLLPSCTFHLSACEIEPLPVLHIYCDPITLPHIQASDESCCSSSSAILKRKKMSQFTTLHTHRHTPAAHIGTPTQTHTQSANLPPYPSVLCPSGLIVHSR